MYMWHVYSLDQCSKACLPGRKAMAAPHTWLLYLLFFPWYQGPGHFVNASVNLKNVPIHYIGLSFAKVWRKFCWRKTAFIWRLGGLNCGLAKASLQKVSTAVWAWKCQNWPMKVSKDQNTLQKHRIWMCSHHSKITVAHLSEVLFDTRLMYRQS